MRFLLTTHLMPQFTPTTFIDADEIVAGLYYNTVWRDGKLRFLGIAPGGPDMRKIFQLIPENQRPEVLLVHADATRDCVPINLPDGIAKFLLVGDTHHLSRPIAGMVDYAIHSKFSAIFVWNRQHAHFFHEAGFPHVFWMPGLIMGVPEFRHFAGVRNNAISFFGQAGQYHPRRVHMIDAIKNSGLPLLSKQMPRLDGLECFARSLIAFNASLNAEFNMRIFEAASAGAMILTDRMSPQAGLEYFFKDGESVVTYGDEKELVEKAGYYLKHPDEAVAIGQRGKAIYDSQFTTAARREVFLNIVQGKPVNPCYLLNDEPRCRLKPAKTQNEFLELGQRIALYEWMQEMHRQEEKVTVDVISPTAPFVLSDLSDLVRLSIRLKGQLASETGIISNPMQLLQVKLEHDASPLAGATLLITDSFSLKDTALIALIASGAYAAVFFGDVTDANRGRIETKMKECGLTPRSNLKAFYIRHTEA